MRVSALSVSRPVTTMMVFLAIVVLGVVAYLRLPVQLLPDITLPTIAVRVGNDRSARDNLEQITKKIESLAAELPRVKQVRSRTRSGEVWVRIDFEYGTDVQYALVDLEERLASFRSSLNDPRTFINAFPFSTADFQQTFLFLSVQGKGDLESLFATASDKVEQQLKALSGVAAVTLEGVVQDAATVDLDPDRLAAYGLELGQVIQRVQAAAAGNNYLGRFAGRREAWFVRLDDAVRTTEELADLPVDGRGVVRLRDVATIQTGKAREWVNRSNGNNSISIRMDREAGQNLIALARAARERVDEINATLPPGVELVINQDFAKIVEEAIDEVKSLAFQGAILALVVPMLFFRSLRVSLVIFLSIPICLIAVFNLFLAAGMSINILSIIGLALGVGMLVDNSIVVVENALRLHQLGVAPEEAARTGGDDVSRGLFASTLTTAAVFVPIVFLDGEFRLFVWEPTLALVFPLLLSLLVALTLVPVFMLGVLRTRSRKGTGPARRRSRSLDFFGWILKGSLRHRGALLFGIAVCLAFTWMESCQRIRESTTSRDANNDWVQVFFQPPRGSDLAEVNRGAVHIEEALARNPQIKNFYVSFNRDGGNASIILKPRGERPDKMSWGEFRSTIIDFIGPIPGFELSLQPFNRAPVDTPLDLGNEGVLELRGLDQDVILPYAERLIEALRTLPPITNARVKEERQEPIYIAGVDRERTGLFGVAAETIGRYISTTRASGTISSLELENGDRRTQVSFVISEAEGDTVDAVKAMRVFAPGFGVVPLGALTRFQASQTAASIRRIDRQSSLEVAYYFLPKTNTASLNEAIREVAARVPNPAGIVLELSGEAQRVDRRQADFFFILIAGSVLVYVVMAGVFESFWVPFVILATNPLMLMGIVWGLDVAGLPLDDMAAFGVILLIGLAVNNGIVLMDRALTLQRAGISRTRAVFEASITRLRPILMTYLTTVLGLLPMALTGDEDDQWRPVAVVIIGGLTSATFLTLVVLPCFYLMGDDFVAWARPGFYAFLKLLFEVPEGITNALFHPIRTWRRELPFIPSLWPTVRALLRLLWEGIRVPLAMLWGLPGDVWAFVRAVLRRRPGAQPLEKIAALAEPGAHAARVQFRNVQVYFAPTSAWRLAGLLPPRFLPAAWRDRAAGVPALHGVHLELENGLVGLLGPNGAGKTTMLRALAGLLEPTRGTVRLFGIAHREAPGLLAPLIGYLPQNHGHYDWMTLREYLDYFATLTAQTIRRGRALAEAGTPLAERLASLASLETPEQREAAILSAAREVNLLGELDRRIGTFSGGMKQRAGIARVLLQAPPIVLVDEPTAGLDPVERVKARLLLARLAESRLVIFSTHITEDLEHTCTHLVVLNKGRVVYSGSPQHLPAPADGPAPRGEAASLEEALLALLRPTGMR